MLAGVIFVLMTSVFTNTQLTYSTSDIMSAPLLKVEGRSNDLFPESLRFSTKGKHIHVSGGSFQNFRKCSYTGASPHCVNVKPFLTGTFSVYHCLPSLCSPMTHLSNKYITNMKES